LRKGPRDWTAAGEFGMQVGRSENVIKREDSWKIAGFSTERQVSERREAITFLVESTWHATRPPSPPLLRGESDGCYLTPQVPSLKPLVL